MRASAALMAFTLAIAFVPTVAADKPSCNDGIDNDGDGATDFPQDAGCTGNGDGDESEPTVPPPATSECSDGIDNDGDGLTDYPLDRGCLGPDDESEGDVALPNPEYVIYQTLQTISCIPNPYCGWI